MVENVYKFNPDRFSGMLGLTDDLSDFYKLHERYRKSKARKDRLALENQSEVLFFTIKHRALEGSISPFTHDALYEHMEELLSD